MRLSRRNTLMLSAGMVLGGTLDAHAQSGTIKIGATAPLTGDGAEIGKLQTEGSRLAVEQINNAGGVNGRKLELVIEDDQTSNPGIILAFSRLISRGDITAVIGSLRSTQVNAMSPDAKKAGIPVLFGGTDPSLTHTGNPWYFRCRPSDAYSAKVIAKYGTETLGKKKWAVIHSADAFGLGGSNALVSSLKAAGIEPVTVQSFTDSQADLTPVVLAVRQSGADIIATYIAYESDVAVFARQLQQFGVNLPWIGSASVASTTAIKLAGPALNNTYAVSDFNTDANAQAKTFSAAFQKAYGRVPDYTSAWPYDAANLIANAIKTSGSTDPQKLRAALLATKGYNGVEGTYNFDANGDGLHGYDIVQNQGGTIKFIQRISFDS
jgi:branched-chain amino acid transport system substrate-binding protein